MSTERILVSPSLHSEFAASIKKQHPNGKLCQLVSPLSASKIKGMVQQALSEGAKLLVGEDVWPPSEDALRKGEFPAVILDNVTTSMKIWRDETFGPVAIILSPKAISSDDEDSSLIDLANDSDYGLAASIFSKDVTRAIRAGRRLESGMVRINAGTVADDATVPFGGYKDTGFGRFNGVDCIRAYTQVSMRREFPVESLSWLKLSTEQTKAITFPLNGAHMLPIH